MGAFNKKTRAMDYADIVVGVCGNHDKWELCCDSHLQGAEEQNTKDIETLKRELEVVLGLYVADYNDRQVIIGTVVKAMEE